MNRFEFSGKLKTILLVGIVIGLLSLIIEYFVVGDELHSQFWGDIMLNNSYFMGMALMALFAMSAFIASWAGWYSVMKRLLEAFNAFLIPGAVIIFIVALGNYFGWHHLYLWNDAHHVANDEVIQGKSAFLNKNTYMILTLLFVGVWLLYRYKLRNLSLLEDAGVKGDYSAHQKMRNWAGTFLPIAGYSSALLIWLWLMSIEVHWYSTMYAWYTAASWFVGVLSVMIITLSYLKTKGYFELVTKEHIHDLGKFLFAFSIFWSYLFFDQYMLIWFGNIGEETVHFKVQQGEFPVIFYTVLILNFIVPFLGLMINSAKKATWVLVSVSILTFIGHWLDMWLNVKPFVGEVTAEFTGVHEHISHYPSIPEIGVMIGFLSLFLFVTFKCLSNAPLLPENDPYLEESIHHHS